MSDDPKPPMPPQPATKEIPALTDRALLEDLTRVVKAGFGEVRLLRADVDLLVGDLASLKVDVRELQRWKIGSEERMEKHSGGITSTGANVKQTSEVNLKQDAAIAMVITKVDRLETATAEQTDRLATIEKKTDYQTVLLTEAKDAAKKLWTHPAVKLLAGAVWGWILYELGKRGIDVPK